MTRNNTNIIFLLSVLLTPQAEKKKAYRQLSVSTHPHIYIVFCHQGLIDCLHHDCDLSAPASLSAATPGLHWWDWLYNSILVILTGMYWISWLIVLSLSQLMWLWVLWMATKQNPTPGLTWFLFSRLRHMSVVDSSSLMSLSWLLHIAGKGTSFVQLQCWVKIDKMTAVQQDNVLDYIN